MDNERGKFTVEKVKAGVQERKNPMRVGDENATVSQDTLKERLEDEQWLNRILEGQNSALEDMAYKDTLTGLQNRRAFDSLIGKIPTWAQKEPVSLIICDIDHFKQINDTRGHDIGDEALKAITQLMPHVVQEMLQETVRAEDIVARIGGEEFAIVLRGVTKEKAYDIAERIRAEVKKMKILPTTGGPVPVAMSFGVASMDDAQDTTGLVKAADVALYAAKKGASYGGNGEGRNQVVTYAPSLLERKQQVA